jgi:hypothetical protein
MIAYNPTTLDNLSVEQEAIKALNKTCLSKEEKDNIDLQYPVDFYTNNLFIRIGMFLLTVVALSFSLGFFSLSFFELFSEKGIAVAGIVYAIGLYVVLEIVVQKRKHYRSGVDDALIWIFAICLFCSIADLIGFNDNYTAYSIVVFVMAGYITVRFANRTMTIIAYLSLLSFLFFVCSHIGGMIKAFVPFVLMAASVITYAIVKKYSDKHNLRYYSSCMQMILIATLLTFYIAGNYYVVRELSNSMFDLRLLPGQTIPFGWLFWLFTIAIPLIYLFFGIKNKDAILIRVSLLLFIALCFTIRNYYSIAPIEIAMTIGGILLIALAYGLTKYLAIPKYGFTDKEIDSDNPLDKLQIESLLIAQSFSHQAIQPDSTKFGGGSFGGGGATGEY